MKSVSYKTAPLKYDSQSELHYFLVEDQSDSDQRGMSSAPISGDGVIPLREERSHVILRDSKDAEGYRMPYHRYVVSALGGAFGFTAYFMGTQRNFLQPSRTTMLFSSSIGALSGLGLAYYFYGDRGADVTSESFLSTPARWSPVGEDNSSKWPYVAHGFMKMDFGPHPFRKGCKLIGIGSGTLISNDVVLTAGHNLYIRDYRDDDLNKSAALHRTARTVSFYPGSFGEVPHWGSSATHIIPHEQYMTESNGEVAKNFDIGLVKLSTPLGRSVGHYGTLILEERALPDVTISGYPAMYEGKEMYTMEGPIISAEKGRMFYDIDTSGGQSGSGVWRVLENGDHRCYGVHAYGTSVHDVEHDGRRYNSGTRIDKAMLGFITRPM